MPEDTEDKIEDFGLMLEGYCADDKETAAKKRLLCYWYSLSTEILQVLSDKRS